jgi:hypothetical protein
MAEPPEHFPFVVDPRWRLLLAPLRPEAPGSGVHIGADGFTARLGPWLVTTPLDNIADATVTGPFAAWKALGPRLSAADRGLTFGTSTVAGVCIRFHRPVRGLDPFGLIRHPGLTVTVARPEQLAQRLRPPQPATEDHPDG